MMDSAGLATALPAVLEPVLGQAPRIENLRALTGGASRLTWAFDAVTGTDRQALILRTGAAEDTNAGMELEARVQRAAAEAGAPVPRVLVADDAADLLGSPFLICAAIEGETIVRRIQRRLDDAGRSRLLDECAHALACIHRSRTDDPALHSDDPLDPWRRRLDETGDTTATFEWAFRWLERHRPTPTSGDLEVLVHGDFRMGNLIVDDDGLAAVLDWELVHRGQRYDDLSWFCVRAWRFGAPADLGAGGLGSIEDFLRAYERAADRAVDRRVFRWWLVLATLRWGIICRLQAERHLSGQSRSVELATIGRRVCENEWDLLDLIGDTTR